MALIIGIILSTISLFDIFWNKPREALFRDMEEFNKAVNAVASLRQEVTRLQYQSNPEMVFAINAMVTPQILANIQYATALLPHLGDRAGIPQLIVLISESINIYDWKSAGKLVERATSLKDIPPSIRSEALRYKARLMFLTGDIPAGRKAYEESLGILSRESVFGINGVRAYIAAEWAVLEYSMGNCTAADEHIQQFNEFVQHPQIAPAVKAGLVSTLTSQVRNTQSNGTICTLPAELRISN